VSDRNTLFDSMSKKEKVAKMYKMSKVLLLQKKQI
jgi:hypothetical protein